MKQEKAASTIVKNCTLIGVNWDKAALDVVSLVAQGLLENASALKAMAQLFNSQHVDIECLLKVE
jgi:hypothetical protein